MKNELLAVAYARVSTREQEEGYSIDAQLNRITKYCANHGMTIIKTFKIIESSTRGKRVEHKKMVDFIIKQKRPLALVCDKIDRLQRSFTEYPTFIKLVQENNLELHFISDNKK